MKNANMNISTFFNMRKMANKLLPRFRGYVITFLLFLGYSMATCSSTTPVHILEKENFSMFGFGDLFFAIFGQNKMLVFVLVMCFLKYKSNLDNNSFFCIGKILLKKFINISVCLIVIFASVFLAYTLSTNISSFNLGFSDRSVFRFILPAQWAILLSFVFSLFYIVTFSLIASIIEYLTHKSWIAILISIVIAYLDVGIRVSFQSKGLIGILLTDNVSVFYLDSIYNGINRPSYIYSFIYWIIMITALCFLCFLLNQKRRIAGDNQ